MYLNKTNYAKIIQNFIFMIFFIGNLCIITSFAQVIPQENYNLVEVSSYQNASYSGDKTYDANTSTMWYAEWDTPELPEWIVLDLNATYTVTGFRMLPRQSTNHNGKILRYDFYVSDNTSTWGDPVMDYQEMPYTDPGTYQAWVDVNFPQAKKGRYIKLVVRTTINGNNYVNITELEIKGVTNQDPSNILLSVNTISENEPIGTTIGTFTTTDPDQADIHTYTLVSGSGSYDNSSFSITDDQLLSAEVFDYETKSNYSIRVQTNDGNGGTFQKIFSILVTDIPEKPQITQHPSDQTVNDGETATFSIIAIGPEPITYQWRKNGTNIPNATSSTYTTPPVTLSDNNIVFDCIATNSYGSESSSEAHLYVNALSPQITTHLP